MSILLIALGISAFSTPRGKARKHLCPDDSFDAHLSRPCVFTAPQNGRGKGGNNWYTQSLRAEARRRILTAMDGDTPTTVIAQRICRNKSQTNKTLNAMMRDGLVIRSGTTRSGKFRTVEHLWRVA